MALLAEYDLSAGDTRREGARAVVAATRQLHLALKEAEGPVDELGLQIGQLIVEVDYLRTLQKTLSQRPETALQACGLDECIKSMQKQLTGAIQQVQFYDRMFQHLSHIKDFLETTSGRLAADAEAAVRGEDEDEALPAFWEALRKRLHRRLLTVQQRELLDATMPPCYDGGTMLRERSAMGSIELF